MGEFTIGQRAGVQILSHAIRRMTVYDPAATALLEEKRKEIRADAESAERLNRAYEGLPSVEDLDTMVEEAKARAATASGNGW